MTQEEILKYSSMDEKKTMILAIVFFLLGMFVVSAILFWPLAGWQLWKYFKIKEAKKLTADTGRWKEEDLLLSKKCSKCGNLNPADYKFCKECGTPL